MLKISSQKKIAYEGLFTKEDISQYINTMNRFIVQLEEAIQQKDTTMEYLLREMKKQTQQMSDAYSALQGPHENDPNTPQIQ